MLSGDCGFDCLLMRLHTDGLIALLDFWNFGSVDLVFKFVLRGWCFRPTVLGACADLVLDLVCGFVVWIARLVGLDLI